MSNERAGPAQNEGDVKELGGDDIALVGLGARHRLFVDAALSSADAMQRRGFVVETDKHLHEFVERLFSASNDCSDESAPAVE
jgi:hypothetical protein